MSPCRWETRAVDPCAIRFSQAECNARFRSGTSLAAAWQGLIAGDLIVHSFPPIKVIASHRRLFSLDNRLLVLWRLMGVFCGLCRVPCLVLIGPLGACRRTLKASGKFTTTCHGSFPTNVDGLTKQSDRCHVFPCERSRFVCRDTEPSANVPNPRHCAFRASVPEAPAVSCYHH